MVTSSVTEGRTQDPQSRVGGRKRPERGWVEGQLHGGWIEGNCRGENDTFLSVHYYPLTLVRKKSLDTSV